MSLIQTSVSATMPKGFAGFATDISSESSCINTEASAAIPFGVVVVGNTASAQLTNPQGVKLPTASGDVVIGITAWAPVTSNDIDTTNDGLRPGRMMRVVGAGRVLVKVENAVVKDARPFFRITANGGNTQLGAIRADADSANAVELKGAYFEESGAAGSLVWLRVNAVANRAVQS